MIEKCEECGAQLNAGGACGDHFNALLLLEYEVAADVEETSGGRGEIAHFYAVSSYVLQHPAGMKYTAKSLHSLRRLVADHLAGQITLAQHRYRVHHTDVGKGHVTRRAGDQIPRWPVATWPMTVVDILAGGTKGYYARVSAGAVSILRTLAEAGA